MATYFDPTLIYYENTIDNAAPDLAARRRELYGRLKPLVGRANVAGVRLLAGTDMVSRPGEWLLMELERLVESGLTARQALRAATTTAAGSFHTFGQSRSGCHSALDVPQRNGSLPKSDPWQRAPSPRTGGGARLWRKPRRAAR